MAPLIISHDGAVHRDTIRRWKDFAPDIKVDWVRMAQNTIRSNMVIWEVIQQGQLGLRRKEKRAPRKK